MTQSRAKTSFSSLRWSVPDSDPVGSASALSTVAARLRRRRGSRFQPQPLSYTHSAECLDVWVKLSSLGTVWSRGLAKCQDGGRAGTSRSVTAFLKRTVACASQTRCLKPQICAGTTDLTLRFL